MTLFDNLEIEMSETEMWKNTMYNLVGIDHSKTWADQMEEDENRENNSKWNPIITLNDIKGGGIQKKEDTFKRNQNLRVGVNLCLF